MSKIWLTADWHWFHDNIIKYCGRPFDTEGQMRNYIKTQFNKLVKPEDEVYILGDMTLLPSRHSSKFMDNVLDLHGRRHIILGNHDRMLPADYLDMYFMSVHTSLEIEYEGRKFFLCHDPAWAQIPGTTCIHGHIHRHYRYKYIRELDIHLVNVGVDVWSFKPVNITEIIALLDKKEEDTYQGFTFLER